MMVVVKAACWADPSVRGMVDEKAVGKVAL